MDGFMDLKCVAKRRFRLGKQKQSKPIFFGEPVQPSTQQALMHRGKSTRGIPTHSLLIQLSANPIVGLERKANGKRWRKK